MFFGSVVKGNYSIGLSDIDIAIVSEEFKDRNKKLLIYDLLFEKYFDSPLEFHILTQEQWNFYLRFIKNDFVEI
ncbi:MAG: nucleotidyltransferase domain-containing protein [Candidatus Aenigmatarchaeota archaeon]